MVEDGILAGFFTSAAGTSKLLKHLFSQVEHVASMDIVAIYNNAKQKMGTATTAKGQEKSGGEAGAKESELLSKEKKLSEFLGEKKFKKLTGPDPDNPKRSMESILEEVEQGVASQKSGIIDEIADRAPGNTGADFIDVNGKLLDVKRASLDLISSPKKINKLVGKLKADPNLKIGLDPRFIGKVDLKKIIDALKGKGVDDQIKIINKDFF